MFIKNPRYKWFSDYSCNTKINEIGNKLLDTSRLVTTTVLNTKISEFESKAPDPAKYITTQEFEKLIAEDFAARLKQVNLVKKTELPQIKLSIQKLKKNPNSLTTKDYNFFLGKIYFASSDGSQNMFIYQPMLDSLELKKDKDIDYVFSCKSKGVYNSKLKPLITAFLYSIKLSEYRVGKNSIKILLTVEKKTMQPSCKYLYCLLFRCLAKKS